MSRLIIVTTPELASGYRLAGAATSIARTGDDAQRLVEELMDETDIAVIAVHGPYWETFDPALMRRLADQILPVVVDIPTGSEAERLSRRGRLAEMLRHAVGQRITFRGGEP